MQLVLEGTGGGIKTSRDMTLLTRYSFQSRCQGRLVTTRYRAQKLVANANEDNGDEGEDERRVGADVPLAEDDAEIGRVPSEEHLESR